MNPKYIARNDTSVAYKRVLLPLLALAISVLPVTVSKGQAATAFNGALKSVAITDAAGTNAPPVAVIEYAQSAGTFSFDASKSSDPDGSIGSYKWDFGDGTKAEGVSVNHALASGTIHLITLTVIDNLGAVCISQISVSGSFLTDTFSVVADTALTSHTPETGAKWSFASGIGGNALVVTSSGVKSNLASSSFAYNTISPSSENYTVSVKGVGNSTSWDRAWGPCVRLTSAGYGYCARLEGGSSVVIFRKDGTGTWNSTAIGTPVKVSGFSSTVTYTLSLTISGNDLTATVNEGTTLKATTTATDNTYSSPGNAGFFINRTEPRVISIEAK